MKHVSGWEDQTLLCSSLGDPGGLSLHELDALLRDMHAHGQVDLYLAPGFDDALWALGRTPKLAEGSSNLHVPDDPPLMYYWGQLNGVRVWSHIAG